MRSYAADLEARLAGQDDQSSEQLIDDLAFAEGRLLQVHPFEDFNGRVSRLFLIELLYRLDQPVIRPRRFITGGDEALLRSLAGV